MSVDQICKMQLCVLVWMLKRCFSTWPTASELWRQCCN